MSEVIKEPRNGCALHGALQTVQEIKGVVPVIHANAGCGVIHYLANKGTSGGNSSYSGLSIPGTAIQERHVIFGGASRLREQIKNTIKVVKGDLYVILNSCESAMVGDDVDAMTREIVEQGEPVLDTLVAGFNGGPYYGYEHVMADIFRTIDGVKPSEKKTDPYLVNILGIIPGKDPYWQGNLEEIKRILEGIGLKVNVFFGPYGGVRDLINAKNAALTINFSRWGELPARILEEWYEIPILQRPSLPLGTEQVLDLATAVAETIHIDEERIKSFFGNEEVYENDLLLRAREDLIEYDNSQTAVLVGDEEQVIRLGRFLTDFLGKEIKAVILTDALKTDEEHVTDNQELLKEITDSIYITSDQKKIEDIIRSEKPEVIFGSSLEKRIANRLEIPVVETSYPVFEKLILNKADAGIRGTISFMEEYITVVNQYEAEKRKQLLSYVKGEKGGKLWQEQSQKRSYSKKLTLVTQSQTKESLSARM